MYVLYCSNSKRDIAVDYYEDEEKEYAKCDADESLCEYRYVRLYKTDLTQEEIESDYSILNDREKVKKVRF